MLAEWIADSESVGGASAEASVHRFGAKSLRGGIGDSAETATIAEAAPEYVARGPTFLARMQHTPALKTAGLWLAQITAIQNLEKSLAENRPRSLIQMATGSGKTFTAISLEARGLG